MNAPVTFAGSTRFRRLASPEDLLGFSVSTRPWALNPRAPTEGRLLTSLSSPRLRRDSSHHRESAVTTKTSSTTLP